MKQTDFRFELCLASGNSQAILNGVEAELRDFNGVNSVTSSEMNGVVELTLNVSFEDGSQAKKLHRKVINLLMNCEGVAISQVSTTLTDIF